MTRLSHRRIFVASVVLALIAGCGGPPGATVGEPMPDFDLEALDGPRINADSLRERPSVIAFWATWCQPCRKDIPELHALLDEGSIRVVSVALDEQRDTVAPYVHTSSIRYPVLFGDQDVFTRFGGFVIPHTVVADADGIIRAVFRGPVTADAIRESVGGTRQGAG